MNPDMQPNMGVEQSHIIWYITFIQIWISVKKTQNYRLTTFGFRSSSDP